MVNMLPVNSLNTVNSDLEELKLILDYAPIGINLLDPSMRIVRLNRFVERMLGVRTEDVKGKYCYEVAGNGRPCKGCGVAESLKDGKIRFFERKVRDRVIRNTSVPVKKNGNIVAVVELIEDVTEKKRMEEELKKSEAKYKDLFENSLDIIAVTNLKGEYLDVNKAFERILGFSKEEVIGRNYREFVGEEVADQIFQMYNKAFREKRDLYGLEAEITTKNGRRVVLEGNIRLIWEGDRIVAFQGNFRDITERKKLENSLEELNDILRLLNKILRHDILNDLAAIGAAIELSLETGEKELLKKALDRIERSSRLIEQIRVLEELTRFKELKAIRIRNLIEDVSRKYGIEIHIEGDGVAEGNEALASVFDNLIGNSIKHGKASRVEIKIEENDFCEVIIADDGIGVPDDIKAFIFDEGFSSSDGSGLGLYIARRIVEACGGSIEVEDREGKGAVFVVKLRKACNR